MEDFIDRILVKLQKLLDFHLSAHLTIGTLFQLLLFSALVVLGESLLRRFFVLRLLQRTHLQPSLQFAIGKIVGYCVLALGFYISFLAAGIDLSSLAIIAGAVGVGLGFGLQNIISNFVSGIIILAERPIAIGDRIDVGHVAGQVREINLRSTTVVTNDNIAIIVPNGEFITKAVTNWSHGDPKVRFRIPVGVAYGTDVEKLQRVLIEIANEHPKALKDPPPTVFFVGFGESALNFELAVWTAELTLNPRRFRSDLNFALERKLRENKIEIPFPQRDLHLRSGSFPINPAVQPKDAAASS